MTMRRRPVLALALAALLLGAVPALAQQERPPVPVVTAKVTSGDIAPQTEYVGTVYFTEISEVAGEVAGKVVAVNVGDGQRVSAGEVLVQLSTDLIDKRINAAAADVESARADLELATLDHERISQLYETKSVAKGEYDQKRLDAKSARHRMASASAELARLRVERDKKTIRAPYDAVVLDTPVHRGEWVPQGTTVAVLARDDEYDIVANVPEKVLQAVRPGLDVTVKSAGQELPGEVFAVIPKGDVATRSFPVKIRVQSVGSLAQGMEARVMLPMGLAGTTLVVPRDAVITSRGQMIVWAVVEGKAQPIPVGVMGYKGLKAGVVSDALKEGMDVVVKGNERLQPGQAVAAQPAEKKAEQ